MRSHQRLTGGMDLPCNLRTHIEDFANADDTGVIDGAW